MPTGTVTSFNAVKGFGFIKPDGDKKTAFVHISEVAKIPATSLHEGQRIQYDVGKDRQDRDCCVNLVILDSRPSALAPGEFVGTVKWYGHSEGHGWITADDGSGNIYVHENDVKRAGLGTLREGERIAYRVFIGKSRKRSAEKLRRI